MSEKEYKNITVVVRTYDAKTDKLENEVVKNIDGHDRRVWLIKTIMWAMFNNKYVEIVNKEDDD